MRHELFMRVLPALRHDMAGPLSVARMGNAVLKRYLVAQPFDPAQSLRRVEQTDEQLNQLLASIRTLARWDHEGGDTIDATEALQAALHLARPMLDLHGVVIDTTDVQAPASWTTVRSARALYMVLGALSCLQDASSGPTAISLAVDGDGVLLQATSTGTASPDDHRPAERVLKLDAEALQWLSADLQWPVEIRAGAVRLGPPAAA